MCHWFVSLWLESKNRAVTTWYQKLSPLWGCSGPPVPSAVICSFITLSLSCSLPKASWVSWFQWPTGMWYVYLYIERHTSIEATSSPCFLVSSSAKIGPWPLLLTWWAHRPKPASAPLLSPPQCWPLPCTGWRGQGNTNGQERNNYFQDLVSLFLLKGKKGKGEPAGSS